MELLLAVTVLGIRTIFTSDQDAEELRVMAHERLGEVLSTLKSVLQKYPPLNSTEIFSAAAALIGKIKSKKKRSLK